MGNSSKGPAYNTNRSKPQTSKNHYAGVRRPHISSNNQATNNKFPAYVNLMQYIVGEVAHIVNRGDQMLSAMKNKEINQALFISLEQLTNTLREWAYTSHAIEE